MYTIDKAWDKEHSHKFPCTSGCREMFDEDNKTNTECGFNLSKDYACNTVTFTLDSNNLRQIHTTSWCMYLI